MLHCRSCPCCISGSKILGLSKSPSDGYLHHLPMWDCCRCTPTASQRVLPQSQHTHSFGFWVALLMEYLCLGALGLAVHVLCRVKTAFSSKRVSTMGRRSPLPAMCGGTIFSAWEISNTTMTATFYSRIDHYHYKGVSTNGLIDCDCYSKLAGSSINSFITLLGYEPAVWTLMVCVKFCCRP